MTYTEEQKEFLDVAKKGDMETIEGYDKEKKERWNDFILMKIVQMKRFNLASKYGIHKSTDEILEDIYSEFKKNASS